MTNSLILFLALTINNAAWMFVFLYAKDKDNKQEEKRFREYVLATKTKTAEQYVETLPSDEPLTPPVQDEMQELGNVDPDKLFKAIKQEHNDS